MNKLFSIPKFDFNHEIVSLIVELEKMRSISIVGTTPHNIFFMIKQLFHLLESVGSARIEGNNTTIAEYLSAEATQKSNPQEEITEISNINELLSYIDDTGPDKLEFNNFTIREFHSLIVKNLEREGSHSPGKYRSGNVKINNSSHTPPEHYQVPEYMDKLFEFINEPNQSQYDLIKIAMVHHAFAWIHPFDNGNGRVVRALTYALMLKYGFKINAIGRVMNPVAVFCADRNQYYDNLQLADVLSDDGVLKWCYYVLSAVKSEYDKTIKLTDYNYVYDKLIKPSIQEYHNIGFISKVDITLIEQIIDKNSFKNSDIKHLFNNDKSSSRKIAELKEKSIIIPIKEASKLYRFNLSNSIFLRIIANQLAKEGFLPNNTVNKK